MKTSAFPFLARPGTVTVSALLVFTAALGTALLFKPKPENPALAKASAASLAITVSAAAPLSLGEKLDAARKNLRGLARRGALLALRENPSGNADFAALVSQEADHQATRELLEKWSAVDPAAAWAWYLKDGKEKLPSFDPTQIVFAGWFAKDSDAAMTAFRQMDYFTASGAASAMLQNLMSDDPAVMERAAKYVDELTNAGGTFHNIVAGLPAVQRLAELSPSTGRDRLLKFSAGMWAVDNWKEALTWSAALPEADRLRMQEHLATVGLQEGSNKIQYAPGYRRSSGSEKLMEGTGAGAWARQWLETEALPGTKVRLGPAAVKFMAKDDPAAALAWASENLGGWTLGKAVGEVIAAQTTTDVPAAAALVETLPPGGIRQQAADQLVKAWTKTDPAAAVTWAMRQPDGKSTLSRNVWENIGSRWGSAAPEQAKEFLTSPAGREAPAEFINYATAQMASNDPNGFLRWANAQNFPEENGRSGPVMRNALNRWVSASPVTAAAALADPAFPALPPDAARVVAGNWFSKDPDAAVNWAAALPPGPLRQQAVESLLENLPKAGADSKADARRGRLK